MEYLPCHLWSWQIWNICHDHKWRHFEDFSKWYNVVHFYLLSNEYLTSALGIYSARFFHGLHVIALWATSWKTLMYTNGKFGKSILQVPDTGTRVLDNTKPFLRSSIVSFWITPARSKGHKYHIFRQYWYTKNVPVFTNTGTFQYLGPEVYFFCKFNSFFQSMCLDCVDYKVNEA